MAQQTTHTGVFNRTRWRSPDEDGVTPRIIGCLEDGTTVIGQADDGDLVPGLTYQFYGRWEEHPEHGKQFKFSQLSIKEPHSRHGVIAYLIRYATGVGPAVASRIWDAFGAESVAVLRTQPELVVSIMPIGRYLPLEKAQTASAALRDLAELEDTKIELTNLFAGRGFPGALIEECVDRWRILAPARIKRDPFCLLVEGLTGCGFARCDRLYADLGLPVDRIKRQVICLWHILKSDGSGNTWSDLDSAAVRLGEMIGGAKVKPKKAIKIGVRAGWLAVHEDESGKLWLAEGERARSESYLAEKLIELGKWAVIAQNRQLEEAVA
jgi:exodeoxyribonuclease V alpha subunit